MRAGVTRARTARSSWPARAHLIAKAMLRRLMSPSVNVPEALRLSRLVE